MIWDEGTNPWLHLNLNSVVAASTGHSVKAFPPFCYSVSKTSEEFGVYRPTVYNSEEDGANERRKGTGGTTP